MRRGLHAIRIYLGSDARPPLLMICGCPVEWVRAQLRRLSATSIIVLMMLATLGLRCGFCATIILRESGSNAEQIYSCLELST